MEAWEEDVNGEKIKIFSNNDEEDNINQNTLKVKAFSDLSGFNYTGPKTSKIDGQFTILKAKQFSSIGIVEDVDNEGAVVVEDTKEFSDVNSETKEEEKQKDFSVVAVRDSLREKKYSPRLYLRRLIISYKQVIKSLGGADKISEEDEKILKSMLTSEVLYLLNRISDDVISKNRNINALLGCSAYSKELRIAAGRLQIIYRMAGLQARKNGYLDKARYQKLQASWSEFVEAVIHEVFKTPGIPKEELENVNEEEEK